MRCAVCHRRLRANRGGCPLHPNGEVLGRAPAMEPLACQIPGWRISGQIGRGGFATVYRGHRLRDGAIAALKVARRPKDPRFERERDALDVVQPPIAPALIEDGVADDGRPWLALELLHGATLGAWMADLPGTGASEPSAACLLLIRIADTLDRVHGLGIVHRDLTPDNIFTCRDDDRIAFLDFGIAADELRGDDLTSVSERLGTALYAAPEQIAAPQDAGPQADRYALGAIAFELLTGRPPFVGTVGEVEQAHAAKRVPRASAYAALPERLDEILARAMAKDPAARYETATAFAAELSHAIEDDDEEPTVTTRGPELPARTRSHQLVVLGLHSSMGASAIAAAVASERGRLARLTGGTAIVAFDRADSPTSGIRAALRAARALPEPTRAVIHIIEAFARRGPRGYELSSPDLDVPTWLPAVDAWPDASPIALTQRASDELPGWCEPARTTGYMVPIVEGAPSIATGRVAIRGRASLLESLAREARHCTRSRAAGLFVLTGEVGLGKSRALAHVAELLEPEALISAFRVGESRTPMIARLASAALGIDVSVASVEAIRERCRQRAGPALTDRAWLALSARCGRRAEADAVAETPVPGAARIALAEFVGAALRHGARDQPLAVLIDDADRLDAVCLDALELATLDDEGIGPWVLLAGAPRLLDQRPDLGQRSARPQRHVLEPLERDSARALLRDLLYPVERVPEATLVAIEQMAQGVPLYLVEIVDALRHSGAIRRRHGVGAWFLAGDDLLHLSSTPLAEKLASRELDALPEAMREFALTAAVLGSEFEAAEVDAVRERAEASGVLDYGDIDTGVALARLVQAGLLREVGRRRFQFRHPMLCAGVESRAPPDLWRHLHGVAYAWLAGSETGVDQHSRQARHAVAGGYPAEGARAWLTSAEADADAHEYARAERRFTAALDQISAGWPDADARDNRDALRLRALAGRAKMRSRLERWREAEADVDQAYAVAVALGDDRGVANALLEKAMILDWTWRWAEAENFVAQASISVERCADEGLGARLLLAWGRCAYRAERHGGALGMLEAAADLASELGDTETRVVAMLLSSVSLTFDKRMAEAEARFDAVIALCEEIGDLHHLAAAYGNRIVLWEALSRLDRAIEDGRRTTQLARRLGHATLESTAGHNLAELLYWRGELDEALILATRARDLYHRHAEEPGPEHDLLLARIHAALREGEAVADILAGLRSRPAHTWSESARLVFDALSLADDDGDGWREVLDRARAVCDAFPDEHLDLIVIALRAAARSGRRDDLLQILGEARAIAGADEPPWSARLAAFDAGTTDD